MSDFNKILENIDEKSLKRLINATYYKNEFKTLAGKTQTKNSAVESNAPADKKLTNRGQHSFQVSKIAYQIVKESGRSEKEALVAELVGICHDLGHTPFGHDGENFFEEKTGERFQHAKYGAKIFDKVFREILNIKEKRTGKAVFDKEIQENLNELKSYVQAGIFSEDIIKNLSELGEYVKSGVSFHQEGYYTFQMDEKLKTASGKELELLEKAIKTPCIQAGMLADTVAIMQSDVRDMMMAKNPFSYDENIITLDNQVEIAQSLGFDKNDIQKMQEQLTMMGQDVDIEGMSENEALREILETLGNTEVTQIQKLIATNIGRKGLNDKGRYESISDEYKLLADNYKSGYEKFKGIEELEEEEWKKKRDEELPKQRALLKATNPLLCLTYEIQNNLMYNEIIYGDKIKLLNNDVERNRAIFSRVYDYLYEVASKPSSELRIDELEDRVHMVQLRKEGNYPKQFNEKSKDGSINKKAIITNLVIFKMQQMGNKELKGFYQEKIASKEKYIENEIDTLQREEKTEQEVLDILQGVNIEKYNEFKQKDTETREKIQEFNSKTQQEISAELKLEKRDIDEIGAEKTTLSRNLEYNMSYEEIKQVEENLGKNELEQKSDMASFEWSKSMSEGEKTRLSMEMLVRNALAYENITESDVKDANNNEHKILTKENEKEGVTLDD